VKEVKTMRTRTWILLCVALGSSVFPAAAQERLVYGTRAQAMGGAVVAASNDATAALGNPAAFAFESGWDVMLPLLVLNVDVGGDILANADAINNDFSRFSLSNVQNGLNNGTITQAERSAALDAFLYRIPGLGAPGEGFAARASLGPALRFGNWGFSASAIAYAGLSPVVDLSQGLALGTGGFANAIPSTPNNCGGNTFCQNFAAGLVTASGGAMTSAQAEQLVFDAGIGKLRNSSTARGILTKIVTQTAAGGVTFLGNRSGVDIRGILIEQYAFTYSRKILGDRLSAGANLKFLRGETYLSDFVVNDLQSGSDLLKSLRDRNNREISTQVGVDLGLLWKPVAGFRVGLTGMNVNAPKFDYANAQGSFKLDTLVRAGGAWTPKGWLTVAADLDLNEVRSQVVDGLKFRYASLGAEFVVLRFLELRAGAYANTAGAGSPLVYTGGIGFHTGAFELAFSGALSTKEVQRTAASPGSSPSTFPSGAGFGISIGWKPRN